MAQDLRGSLDACVKPDASIVTRADFEIETWLRDELPRLAPGSAVWGEEKGFAEEGSGGLWLVDPVDGTSNYAFGSPLWGVSIAWMLGGRIRLGAVALPDLGEAYSAAEGEGVTRNGERLPALRPGEIRNEELVACSPALFRRPGFRCPGNVRYNGAFVIEGAFFACGRYRALLSVRASLYDMAACLCLAREAGGDVRHLDGTPFDEAPSTQPSLIEPAFGFFPPGCGWRDDPQPTPAPPPPGGR
jgi:myo-inositol-1(or 4)-monophosphatase